MAKLYTLKHWQSLIMLCFLGFGIQAQSIQGNGFAGCGTDHMVGEALRLHPEYKVALDKLEKETFSVQGAKRLAAQNGVLTVPVVVHVIHNYGPEFIGLAQVHDAIRIVNEDFQKHNADTTDIIPQFKPIIGNAKFRFVLAKKDPNGNCTNGVTYTVDPRTTSASDNVKSGTAWDITKYLNIWVVRTVLAGTQVVGGYSYFPGTGGPNDGVIVTCEQFGSLAPSSSNNFSSRTLTHEIGHYMNLRHTFGATNGPGAQTNCTAGGGDLVADTPPTIGVANQTCPKYTMMDCGSLANVQNYMDYSSCGQMFTAGQVTRMQTAIASNTASRNNLWSAANLAATGVNDTVVHICAPKVNIQSSSKTSCNGLIPVTFSASIYNTTIDTTLRYFWSFQGGVPATSTSPTPSVLYPNFGQYDVSLKVLNQYGADSITLSSYIDAAGGQAGAIAPNYESFEAANFPEINATQSNFNWTYIYNNTQTWQQTHDTAYSGTASVMIDNQNIPAGSVNDLISPVVDLNQLPDSGGKILLSYRFAYPLVGNTKRDRLVTSYTTDCGNNWQLLIARGKNSTHVLNTTSRGNTAGTFIPNHNEWNLDSLNFVGLPLGSPQVQVKFSVTSNGGSRLYLDDFRVSFVPDHPQGLAGEVQQSAQVSVFPNPNKGNFTLLFKGSANEKVKARIQDVLGQEVYSMEAELDSEGNLHYTPNPLHQTLSPGIYMVSSQVGRQMVFTKLLINR